jgi:predicted kinase
VSDHARFLFFRNAHRHPDTPVQEHFRAEVVLLSGPPGVGKDTWLRQHLSGWPVISLDALRGELDIDPADEQGRVVNQAREQARQYLRQGQSFVWNATNVSRQVRGQCIQLFADYHARIRIVYVQAPEKRLLCQNRQRPVPVPQAVLERLLDRWEVPDRTEAHNVEWFVD